MLTREQGRKSEVRVRVSYIGASRVGLFDWA